MYVITDNYALLLLGSAIGLIGAGSGAGGPIFPIQQALLADQTSPKERNSVFGFSSFAFTIAASAGALMVGLPDILAKVMSISLLDGQRSMYALTVVFSAVYIVIVSRIREPRREMKGKPIIPVKSKGVIVKYSTFRAFDGLGQGTFTPLLSYWFFLQFGVPLTSMAIIFSLSELASALGMIGAARLAKRFGSLNSIVVTQAPGIALLFVLPFAPNLIAATVIMIAKEIFGQMDIPLKQAYLMSVVTPEERASVAGITSVMTFVPQSMGGTIAGYFFQFVSLSSPFIFSGVTKAFGYGYLYMAFRKIKPVYERETQEE